MRIRKHFSKQRTAVWLFLLPEMIGVSLFYLIPFADVVRRSFSRTMGGFSGLNNYKQVLSNPAFQLAAGNTLKFVAVCLPLLLILSLGVALMLQKIVRGKQLLKSMYLLPLAIPAASVVLLWKLVFHPQGLLNALLNAFHLSGTDWMNTGAAFGVLIFTYVWKNLGYDVILWTAGLLAIPKSIYEAADVDGAGGWARFWWITLPNLRPTAFTILVLSVLNSFKVFREAYLVAGSYPQESIYLLQHVFNNWFQDLSVDKMSAGSVLLALVVLGFVLLLQRSWDKEDMT